MQVHINEIVSQVRTLDGSTPLSQQTLQQIVSAVLAALTEQKTHDRHRELDTRVAGAQEETRP